MTAISEPASARVPALIDWMTGGALAPVDIEAVPFTQTPALLEGAVGLVSTVPDYMRFARMLLNEGALGTVRLLNVLPMTPVMLAEYVPADFDAQQRATSEEALTIVANESGIEASRISSAVRQGGIYHEILEEASAIKADLIVMTSHRPAMRTYFLGSNAGHVVRYARCSVLVVRH